jgi:von Willebrand factor type A domain
MPLAFLGISFLSPVDAVFALAAAAPVAAYLLMERRAGQVRGVLGVHGPGRRALAPVVVSLVLLPALVAVAAAQPVVVRRQVVHERSDAQAFFVLDTSLSMDASGGPGDPTRLQRARRLAARLEARLPDVPIGLAGMTDRVLPYILPTTDPALFAHALAQSVGIDRPPPSQAYHRARATNLQALVPIFNANFFSQGTKRRLVVVFTDGEAPSDLQLLGLGMARSLRPVFVHVWAPGERIYRHGKPDPYYTGDPASANVLARAAQVTGGSVFDEHEFGKISAEARDIVGQGPRTGRVSAYARIALAPWVALSGIFPLGFLLYRRNF